MKNILLLDNNEAKTFLLKNESYINIDLPPYIKLDKLLLALSKKIGTKDYFGIKKSNPNDLEDVNYKLLHNKNGKYSWRPLQLIHPVLYISLVNQITKFDSWKEIKELFEYIRDKSVVNCISLPIVSETKKSDKAEQVLNWWEQIEQKSLEFSIEFSYIYHTDISDCYSSIYTHSIPWAIHSKCIAKRMRPNTKQGRKLIGNIIDRHLQAMSYGQTNGIPQGSVLMDFIAEIILHYADLKLTEEIKNKLPKNSFKILRYRDDYRIFVNNPTIADEIIKKLTEVLINLGLKLNSQKTLNFNNIIEGSIKPDKFDWMMCKRDATTIQKKLLILHKFSSKYPNSGTLNKELENIFDEINKKTYNKNIKKLKKIKWYISYEKLIIKNCTYQLNLFIKNKRLVNFKKEENINVLISIVVDIAYHNPKVYPISVAILSKLFNLIDDDREVIDITNKIIKKFNNLPNTGYLEIWLQRAIIKLNFNKNIFEEDICKLVNGENIKLWNNDWLGKSIIEIFNKNLIIDKNEIKKTPKYISKNEVSLFNRY